MYIHFADLETSTLRTTPAINYNPMVPFAVRPPPPPPYYAVHPLSALTSADLPAYRSSASCWKKAPRGAHRRCDAAAATGRGPRSDDDSRVPVRATNQVSGRRQCHPFLLVIPSRLVGLVDGTLRCTDALITTSPLRLQHTSHLIDIDRVRVHMLHTYIILYIIKRNTEMSTSARTNKAY